MIKHDGKKNIYSCNFCLVSMVTACGGLVNVQFVINCSEMITLTDIFQSSVNATSLLL